MTPARQTTEAAATQPGQTTEAAATQAGQTTNAPATPPGQHPSERPAVDEIRATVTHLLSADRRLRSRDHSGAGELTFAQIRSLAALGRDREMTAGQLAKSAELNPATVTAMLDHLEAAGIVQRHRSTQDRRVCNVSLTDQGWEVLERKLSAWRSMWEEHLADFSDEEIATAGRVLSAITEMLDDIPKRAAPASARTAP